MEAIEAPPRAMEPGTDGPGTFERVYAAEHRGLLTLAHTLTGNRSVAEEIVQEAFLRLHQRWATISAYDRPGAWTRRVVLHLATSGTRRALAEAKAMARLGRQRRPPEPGLSDEATEFFAALRGLARRQSQVLGLYYAEDLSVAEIAGILRCAEGTVRAHLHQGRRALAARLGIDHEEGDGR